MKVNLCANTFLRFGVSDIFQDDYLCLEFSNKHGTCFQLNWKKNDVSGEGA